MTRDVLALVAVVLLVASAIVPAAAVSGAAEPASPDATPTPSVANTALQPAPTGDAPQLADLGPGNHSVDVSDRDWVYIEVRGAGGEDGENGDQGATSGGDSSDGGAASGWLDVSGVSQLDAAVAAQGSVDGWDDGTTGGSGANDGGDGGDGAGSTGVGWGGTVRMEAGGGGGGGGGGPGGAGSGGDGGDGGGAEATGGVGGDGGGAGDSGDDATGPGGGYVDSATVQNASTQAGVGTGNGQVTVFAAQDSAPVLSNVSPSDGILVEDGGVTLSADMTDGDFGQIGGDELSVTFYDESDNSVIGTEVLASNGTASVEWAPPDGGRQSWSVEAVDEGNLTATSAVREVVFGGVVQIRSVDDGSLIDDRTVNASFFPQDGSADVVERSTSDGELGFGGLEPGTSYVVRAAADGYTTRHIPLPELTNLASVYLLSDSASVATVQFAIDDRTGNFPTEETQLLIERPVPVNGSLDWQTVAGDVFGASDVTVMLEQDQRYRLRIRNANGNERVLGAYTAAVDEARTLTVGAIEWTIGDPQAERLVWQATYVEEGGDEYVQVALNADADSLEDVDLAIFEDGNRSNELHNATHVGPYGNLAVTVGPLTPAQRNATWAVEWEASRGGEVVEGRTIVGSGRFPIATSLGDRAMEVLVVGIIIFVAGWFPAALAAIGAIVTSLTALMLWSIGWLDLPLYWILAALAVGVLARVAKTGGLSR